MGYLPVSAEMRKALLNGYSLQLKALSVFLHQIANGAAHSKYQRHFYTTKSDEMPGKRCSSLSEKEIRGKFSWRLIFTSTKLVLLHCL